MKLFLLILVFVGIKGHSIPTNGTNGNITTTESPITSQILAKIDKIQEELATNKDLILGFCIFFTVVICLVFLGCLIDFVINFKKIMNYFKKLCCSKKKIKEKRTIEEMTKVAYHEAGHAIVAFYHKDGPGIKEITIKHTAHTLGRMIPEQRRYWAYKTQNQILAEISTFYGGRIVDELQYGQLCQGARSDISRATTLARDMVQNLGMSDKIGLRKLYDDKSEEAKKIFDEEVDAILKEAYETAKAIINEHWEELKVLAHAIVEYETLRGHEVKEILEGKRLLRKKKVDLATIRKDDEEPLAENDANSADSVA